MTRKHSRRPQTTYTRPRLLAFHTRPLLERGGDGETHHGLTISVFLDRARKASMRRHGCSSVGVRVRPIMVAQSRVFLDRSRKASMRRHGGLSDRRGTSLLLGLSRKHVNQASTGARGPFALSRFLVLICWMPLSCLKKQGGTVMVFKDSNSRLSWHCSPE
jgi:hypothetical protein